MPSSRLSAIAYFLLCISIISAATTSLSNRGLTNSQNPPSGALVVRQTKPGSGEFSTINQAVQALKSRSGPQVIFIYPGHYRESVRIKYDSPLTIQGYTENPSSYAANLVTMEKPTSAAAAGGDAESSVIWAQVDDFKLFNVNAINSYGAGTDKQAIAVTAQGDRQEYRGCKFDSFQDTLYIKSAASFFEGCLILGGVDFIFGGGSAWFEKCTIGVKPSPRNGITTITAQKSPGSGKTRFVFNRSQVVGAGNTDVHSAYLGRPWSPYSSVTFQFCSLPNLINPDGWLAWSPSDPRTWNVNYQEFQNSGEGARGVRRYGRYASAALKISDVFASYPGSWTTS